MSQKGIILVLITPFTVVYSNPLMILKLGDFLSKNWINTIRRKSSLDRVPCRKITKME